MRWGLGDKGMLLPNRRAILAGLVFGSIACGSADESISDSLEDGMRARAEDGDRRHAPAPPATTPTTPRGVNMSASPSVDGVAPDLPALCGRDLHDAVRDVVCAQSPPRIESLAQLQRALDIVPSEISTEQASSSFVTALGHSTALSGHRISPINPRLIVVTQPVIMAFQRGVQTVEVIARARERDLYLNFYLFQFEQACNRSDRGCTPGDLYTARVEDDWIAWTVRDGEELKNTSSDCRQCHQRGREVPKLLMRELENPWTHFLQPAAPDDAGPGVQGPDLLQDYFAAKGSEPYGGFAFESLLGLAPFLLELAVGRDQPVLFDAPGIESERFPFQPETGYPDSPAPSATWQAAYEAFKQGEQLALPYVDARVTDPNKLARYTDAYTRYRAGELSADELPDLADIFPEDPWVRAQIGLQTEPGGSAQDVLIQACGSCHNDVLDQTLSRARFNIDLWRLDAAEIATAVERIERAPEQAGVMPPPEARQLDAGGRERLLQYLRSDPRAQSPDARLQRAAALGMAGGQDRRAMERR